MKLITSVAMCVMLTACVDVVEATPRSIWVQEPFVGFQDADSVAAEHCAQFGRRAVAQGQFGGGDTSYLPILAYNCE